MAYSKASQRAVDRYVKKNYDNVTLRVPKGQKAEIQAVATAIGESLNRYIVTAIHERTERVRACHPQGEQDLEKAGHPLE